LKKTWIWFGMSFDRFDLKKNAVLFGYYSHLLLT